MPRNRTFLALAILLFGSGIEAVAQAPGAVRDGAAAEIRGRLRSFYFNLAHNDWEALTADILAAKVVAHRPPPENLVLGLRTPARTGLSRVGPACSTSQSVSIEQTVITIEGDWAEVAVPHCGPVGGRDEFRLIRFGGRWRFVSVHLFEQPVNAMVDR
ncbi:MAG TPA: hypothetical protein VFH24_02355 [Gemmatimonadales bacterium]|nr:hypothetical protein [Gemmatimonadales bacterium]